MFGSTLDEMRLWHLALVLSIALLVPLFRAFAVILVARTVDPELARIAIPLILRPWSAALFRPKKTPERVCAETRSEG